MAERPLKRCGELVVFLRIPDAMIEVFGPNQALATPDCPKEWRGGALEVEAMALHPAGVAVKLKGGRIEIVRRYTRATIAKGEQ